MEQSTAHLLVIIIEQRCFKTSSSLTKLNIHFDKMKIFHTEKTPSITQQFTSFYQYYLSLVQKQMYKKNNSKAYAHWHLLWTMQTKHSTHRTLCSQVGTMKTTFGLRSHLMPLTIKYKNINSGLLPYVWG